MDSALTLADYQSLAELRYQIRRFLHFSEQLSCMADLEPHQGTFTGGIDVGGSIMGNYVDLSGVSHGFLRAPDGTITKFDATGSTYTIAHGLNLEEDSPAWTRRSSRIETSWWEG